MSYDDYEQSERVREWLRHNAVAIIVGIVIGLALIFGYRQWTKHKASENVAAANQYRLVEHAYATGKPEQASTLTDSLIKHHADSTYAVLAASLRARHQLAAGKTKNAVASLTWANEHAPSGPLKSLTQLRLARVQMNVGQARQALATLDKIPAGAYSGMVANLRGDLELKLGNKDAAGKAWRAALLAFKPEAPQRRIVQMKLDNIAHGAGKPQPAKAKAAQAGTTLVTPSSSAKQDA